MTKRIALAALLVGIVTAPVISTSAAKDTPWDINQPPVEGSSRTLNIDVQSGTWMSLDVSPDGQTIVFDLLGDVYKMPIEGGPATALSRGLAWDMHPRFSPDGQRIAFASDRHGSQNIWTMDVTGNAVQQITHEAQQLLHSPTWSPDGQFIAARKDQSLNQPGDAPEIWIYHVDGGRGLQLVTQKRESESLGLGAPAYAPDGKALFYSQEGALASASKNLNNETGGVFQINRLDLQTGQITTVTREPGGTMQATPSPDGRYLAYVKRVRAQSQLVVKDLSSGVETLVDGQLDQDGQAGPSTQSLYPNMDWTPDSATLIYWAGGKLWRADLMGSKMEIAFRITDSRTALPVARQSLNMDTDQFDTRMARFTAPSPAGDQVVFEALGKLYLKAGDAPPQRLTRDESDTFELYPIWSPDGKIIYFITWDDDQLGSIRRVASRAGSRATIMTWEKGHFSALSIAPDGKTLAFVKGPGGDLVTPDWGAAPGLYTISSGGGPFRRIHSAGSEPHFGPGGRIFATHQTDAGLELFSLTAVGYDKRVHAVSAHADRMRISPQGRQVAFRENHQLYLSPLPAVGKAIRLARVRADVPVRQVSHLGAAYFGFSRTGSSLYWSIGPDYYTVATDRVGAASYTPPLQPIQRLSLIAQTPKPKAITALVGAHILTMAPGSPVIEDGTVVIEGNKILMIGRRTAVSVPSGARRIDLSGKTIIPGLIDSYAAVRYGSGDIIPQQNWSTDAHLALGVTTLHVPADRHGQLYAAAEYARAGITLAPRMITAGTINTRTLLSGHFNGLSSLEDALTHVRRLKAMGAKSIIHSNVSRRDQRQMLAEAARQEGLIAIGEASKVSHSGMALALDGYNGVANIPPNKALYDDILSLWAQTDVGLTPSLATGYLGLATEDYEYMRSDIWKHPIVSQRVPPTILQPATVQRLKAPAEDFADEAALAAQELTGKGIEVTVGTRGKREGLGTHWHIWRFVRAGMSPMAALQAATIIPARQLGLEEDLGTIEVGKLADLVILDGNPLEDIRVTDQIHAVMLNGRLYDPKTLNERETGAYQHRPYYWEDEVKTDSQ